MSAFYGYVDSFLCGKLMEDERNFSILFERFCSSKTAPHWKELVKLSHIKFDFSIKTDNRIQIAKLVRMKQSFIVSLWIMSENYFTSRIDIKF